VKTLFECLNRDGLDSPEFRSLAEASAHEKISLLNPGFSEPLVGVGTVLDWVTEFGSALPDAVVMNTELKKQDASGNVVKINGDFQGTHMQPLFGFKACKAQIAVPFSVTFYFRNDKCYNVIIAWNMRHVFALVGSILNPQYKDLFQALENK
jgi:hypothetical protein